MSDRPYHLRGDDWGAAVKLWRAAAAAPADPENDVEVRWSAASALYKLGALDGIASNYNPLQEEKTLMLLWILPTTFLVGINDPFSFWFGALLTASIALLWSMYSALRASKKYYADAFDLRVALSLYEIKLGGEYHGFFLETPRTIILRGARPEKSVNSDASG